MAETNHVIVQFLKSHKCYNVGDRAGFTQAHAKFLCDNGIAKPAKSGSILRRPKKDDDGRKLVPGVRVRFFIPKEGDAIGTIVKAHGKKETVIVEYDGAELELKRSELTFIAPPDPEAQTGDTVELPIEVGARVEFREGDRASIGTVAGIEGDTFTIDPEGGEGAQRKVFREFVRLPRSGDGDGGSDGSDAGDGK